VRAGVASEWERMVGQRLITSDYGTQVKVKIEASQWNEQLDNKE